MTGRLPHRVSDALSTKTDRSYVSPSPKNSLSFQELPHNQSNKPTKTHAETAPDSHPTDDEEGVIDGFDEAGLKDDATS